MRAKRQYAQIKTGDYTNVSEKTIENIKRIVFNKLTNHNRNIDQYEYVLKRMYGKSHWIVDERGKVLDTGGAIWYKPVNRKEYCDDMFFTNEERKIMESLFLSINENANQIYILEYPNGDKIEAQVDTCYETDNGLEMEDLNYEEYHACAMRIVKVIEDKNGSFKEGSLIEINYHNYPQQICFGRRR